MQTVSFTLDVPDNAPVATLTASVDLKHTFIGDLVITLKPPASTGVAPIVLHDRAGGSTKNLKKTYDSANTPKLAGLTGKSCKGVWTLEIKDTAPADFGTLISFSLGLTFPHT